MQLFGISPVPRRHPTAHASRLMSVMARTPGTLTIRQRARETGPSASDDSRETYLVLRDVKGRLVPAIRMQYMQVAGQPGTDGKIVLRWTVLSDGRTSNVVVDSSSVQSPELIRRVVALVSRWIHPSVPKPTTVHFPFVFG